MISRQNKNKKLISSHLLELRNKLIYFFVFFLFSFLFSYFFIDKILNFIVEPFINSIEFKNNKRLIYTGLTEVFLSYLKISIISAFILSAPFLIYQIWSFVAPGLLNKEKRIIYPFLFLVPVMFLIGFIFVYYFIIPLAWDFFVSFDTSQSNNNYTIELEPKINEYISLSLKLAFIFGLAFQLPIIILLLTVLKLISPNDLKKKRRYIIVIIFLVSAIVTPPDIFSQVGLALPIIILYEFSLLLSQYLENKKK